ncbi:MAG: hypothetical protein GXP02_04640 [Alphaproteobacteria bacterium]|nr:hypothetical protein [Alphaproteobacteria bacterium]
MSSLPENFDYVRPATLDQLSALVTEYQQKDRSFAFSAGGTDLIPKLKTRLLNLDSLISLNGLTELTGIEKHAHHITIGALSTLSEVADSDLISQYLPTLGDAARKVASPQIRNRATIGGNIMVDNRCSYINQSPINRESHSPCFKAGGDVCHLVKSAKRGDEILCQARFVSDTAPVLLLLDAKITITGAAGPRKIKLAELYLNDGIDNKNINSGEVITAIDIEIPDKCRMDYQKLAIRNALDFPSLGVAVRLSDNGVSVALTGLNPRPGVFQADTADYDSFDNMIAAICAEAMGFAVTYQQDFFPRGYRKDMIAVFIRRGVDRIMKESKT